MEAVALNERIAQTQEQRRRDNISDSLSPKVEGYGTQVVGVWPATSATS
jgi:hypothetical protein